MIEMGSGTGTKQMLGQQEIDSGTEQMDRGPAILLVSSQHPPMQGAPEPLTCPMTSVSLSVSHRPQLEHHFLRETFLGGLHPITCPLAPHVHPALDSLFYQSARQVMVAFTPVITWAPLPPGQTKAPCGQRPRAHRSQGAQDPAQRGCPTVAPIQPRSFP